MKNVLPEERRPLLFATAFFFFALAGYYVIRPLRDAMGIRGAGEKLSLLFFGTLAGTLVLNAALARLMTRTPRIVFVPIAYRVVIASLVLFSIALRLGSPDDQKRTAAAFFVWVSVFVMFLTALFWGVIVDVFRPEQGKRLFGLIGAGGTAGGIAGAALTAALVKAIGAENMILVGALLLEVSVRCMKALVRSADAVAPPPAEAPAARGAWSGAARVLSNPYLIGISLFLLLYTISSTFLYFEQARIVRRAFATSAERTAFFARIDLVVNVATVVIQTLLTARVLRLLGTGGTLALLPLVTIGGFAALWRRPATAVLFAVQTVRRSVEYGVIRPARELLFTVVPREEKYAGKTFIDTFVYRGGDAIGALVDIALTAAKAGEGLALVAFLPIGAGWAWLAARLGAEQERRRAIDAAPPAGRR